MLIQRPHRTSPPMPHHSLLPPLPLPPSVRRLMASPRSLFILLCCAVACIIVLSLQHLNNDHDLDLAVTNTTGPLNIRTSTPKPQDLYKNKGNHKNTNTNNNNNNNNNNNDHQENDENDDFGVMDDDGGTEHVATSSASTTPIKNKEAEMRNKRTEQLGAMEQANVATYENGVMGIYPATGSELGGTKLTFIFAIQKESTAGVWPQTGYFGGCIVDGVWMPLTDSAFYSPSQVFLLSCQVPPHAPGEVEVSLLVDNVTRYADNGTVRFTYTSSDSGNSTSVMTELALCTVMQDQGRYLREWIAFHTIFGVTKFYLYDQSSSDDWKVPIQDFIDSGLVVPVRWRFNWIVSVRHQAIGFWHGIKTFGAHTRWMGFIDVDEFLFIPRVPGLSVPSLPSFLSAFEDVGGVMVDRINFGPNGHKVRPPGLVIENYTKRTPTDRSEQPGKSIVQPKHVRWAGCGGVHTFDLQEGWLNVDGYKRTRDNGCGIPYDNVVWDPIRINHYWTKSAQDWAERQSRDRKVYPIPAEELLQKWPYFTEEDHDIIQYAEETKKRMLWGIH